MAHITPQTSFRLGKTFIWHHNALIPTKQFPRTIVGNVSKTAGIEKLLKYILKKRRIFIVKANLKFCLLQTKYYLHILFLPKIKKSPKKLMRKLVIKTFMHHNFRYLNQNFCSMLSDFAMDRREKIFRFHPKKL